MKTETENKHVIMHGKGVMCKHCGDIYEPQLPMSLQGMIDRFQEFTDKHSNCKAN